MERNPSQPLDLAVTWNPLQVLRAMTFYGSRTRFPPESPRLACRANIIDRSLKWKERAVIALRACISLLSNEDEAPEIIQFPLRVPSFCFEHPSSRAALLLGVDHRPTSAGQRTHVAVVLLSHGRAMVLDFQVPTVTARSGSIMQECAHAGRHHLI